MYTQVDFPSVMARVVGDDTWHHMLYAESVHLTYRELGDHALVIHLYDHPDVRAISEHDTLREVCVRHESGLTLGPFLLEQVTYTPARDEDDLDHVRWDLYGPFREDTD